MRPTILECGGLFTLLAPIFEGSFEGPPLLRRKQPRKSALLQWMQLQTAALFPASLRSPDARHLRPG